MLAKAERSGDLRAVRHLATNKHPKHGFNIQSRAGGNDGHLFGHCFLAIHLKLQLYRPIPCTVHWFLLFEGLNESDLTPKAGRGSASFFSALSQVAAHFRRPVPEAFGGEHQRAKIRGEP